MRVKNKVFETYLELLARFPTLFTLNIFVALRQKVRQQTNHTLEMFFFVREDFKKIKKL